MDANTARASNRQEGLITYLTKPGWAVVLVQLAIVGLLAIGLSGLVAARMGAAFGKSFVAGDAPGVSYSKARCADYFEYEPHAHSCEQAATMHHYGEVVGYRMDAGILGLIILVGYLVYRRRAAFQSQLPEALTPAVAAAAFGLAAVGLLGQSFILLARDQRPELGTYLSAGVVSFIAAIVSAVWLLLVRRRSAPSDVIHGAAL
jgi:hypothetical protein